MKDEKKVFLYFLKFCADDLRVFYDDTGIAAVAYDGDYDFLQSSDVIIHCFDEGYIERVESVAFVLYAFTDDPDIAKSFERSRNMSIFKKMKVTMSQGEFANLNRFREAKLSMESVLYGPSKYMDIAINQFEVSKVFGVDEGSIISEWGDYTEVFEFLPMSKDGAHCDCFAEPLRSALQYLKFGYFIGDAECYYPLDTGIQVNEWSVFYSHFSNTLA